MRAALSVIVAVVLALGGAQVAVAAAPVCAERSDPTQCDADRDRITDSIEVQVCGTATCATGREDRDRDGIPDWSELLACGTARCAETGTDLDADGIPDFAEQFVCGTATCSGAREDVDGDKIGDWVEFVICGDRTCANGSEDYDNDGISDAKQLTACVVAFDVTGSVFRFAPVVSFESTGDGMTVVFIWWPFIVGGILALVGFVWFGLAFWQQRRRDAEREASEVEAYDVDSLEELFK